MAVTPEILPDSRLRNPVRVQRGPLGLNWQPIFCANCGKEGGSVPELPENCNFAFYICNDCAEAGLGKTLENGGYYVEPDAVFWAKVKAAQLEEDGRELTGDEVAEALKDSTHYLAKLVTERDSYLRKSRKV